MINWYRFSSNVNIDSRNYEDSVFHLFNESRQNQLDYHDKLSQNPPDISKLSSDIKASNYPKADSLINSMQNANSFDREIRSFFTWTTLPEQRGKIDRSIMKRLWDLDYIYSNQTPENEESSVNNAKDLIGKTLGNAKKLLEKINSIKPQEVTLPIFIQIPSIENVDFERKTQPMDTFYVKVGPGKDAPGFTIFPDGEIDDIIEGGDDDFFENENIESQYFSLISALKPKPEKTLKLYTARPSKDRSLYLNATQIPSNIYLTSSLDSAIGIAKDFGNRDVWEIKISNKYLLDTLNNPKEKQYQVIGKNGFAEIVSIQLVEKDV